MTTKLVPGPSFTISDLDDATAANRAILTTGVTTETAKLYVTNQSDAVVYVTNNGDDTTSGRGIPAGATVELGPYLIAGLAAWLYGTGAGSAHYGWDPVRSEN